LTLRWFGEAGRTWIRGFAERYVGSGAGCSLGGWKESLASCYGSMADAPIERGKPGELEIPGPLR
jgi:hypothetical protein